MKLIQVLSYPECGIAVGVFLCLVATYLFHTKNPAQIPLRRILVRVAGVVLYWLFSWYLLSFLLFRGLKASLYFKETPDWPLACAIGLLLPSIAFIFQRVIVTERWFEIFVLRFGAQLLTWLSEGTFVHAALIIREEERGAGYDIENNFGEAGKIAIDKLYEKYVVAIAFERAWQQKEKSGGDLTADELERVTGLSKVNSKSIKIKLLLYHLGYAKLVREQQNAMEHPSKDFPPSSWPSDVGDRRVRQSEDSPRRRASDKIMEKAILASIGQTSQHRSDLFPSTDHLSWFVNPSPLHPTLPPKTLVMRGGGVKGIAYLGALEVLEEYGYRFDHFVGTSAGAIFAALLAVGYSTRDLQDILGKTNFEDFKDGRLLPSILLLPITKGLHPGKKLTLWLENHLRGKFPQTFGAIPILFKHLKDASGDVRRLTIYASVRNKSAHCFDSEAPKDQEIEISYACRCSMAIPVIFQPERIQGDMVFDGGLQNNYPLKAILEREPALRESGNFVGLYLGSKGARIKSNWAWRTLFSIATEARDEEAKTEYIHKTVIIDPQPVQTTEFSLSQNDIKFLIAEGRASALHWLFYNSEAGRPTEEIFKRAKEQAVYLRAVTTNERKVQKKKAKQKRLLLLLFFLLLTLSSVYGGFWYFWK